MFTKFYWADSSIGLLLLINLTINSTAFYSLTINQLIVLLVLFILDSHCHSCNKTQQTHKDHNHSHLHIMLYIYGPRQKILTESFWMYWSLNRSICPVYLSTNRNFLIPYLRKLCEIQIREAAAKLAWETTISISKLCIWPFSQPGQLESWRITTGINKPISKKIIQDSPTLQIEFCLKPRRARNESNLFSVLSRWLQSSASWFSAFSWLWDCWVCSASALSRGVWSRGWEYDSSSGTSTTTCIWVSAIDQKIYQFYIKQLKKVKKVSLNLI